MNHVDRSIYLISYMRAGRESVSVDDSRLVGTLGLLLDKQPCTTGIAQSLLEELRVHPDFERTDRVCIASTSPNTRELAVVDSASHGDMGEDLMRPGYRCFVRPDSSLFKLKEGVVRIFENIEHVIEAFASENREVQRSMAYLSRMGLRSGLCLPLSTVAGPCGFLFLNSRTPDAYVRCEDGKHHILSVLSLFARSVVLSERRPLELPVRIVLPATLPLTCTSTGQIAQALSDVALQPASGRERVLVASPDPRPFLFASRNLVEMFAWIQLIVGPPPGAIRISSEVADGRVAIVFTGYETVRPHDHQIAFLTSLAPTYDYELRWSPGASPRVEMRFEATDGPGERLYSVAARAPVNSA